MPEETTPVADPVTFEQVEQMIEQAEQMIDLLLALQQIGFWLFGAFFILIGLLTMQVFFVGKGDD